MNKPSFSAIMANYNHAHYLPESLGAILNQSLRPLEVIIVDDGSTDNSVSVIEEFSRRDPIVRLLRNEQNMGPLFSVNRGAKFAKGDYLYFNAADDRVLPGFFEKSINILMCHPQAGLSLSDPVYFNNLNYKFTRPTGLSDQPRYYHPEELLYLMRKKAYDLALLGVIVKRSAWEEAGRFLPDLYWIADYFNFFVIAFRHGICHIPQPLVEFRISEHSYSASRANDYRFRREVIKRILSLLESPRYKDVRDYFKRSCIFAGFRMDTLRVILGSPKYRDYLSLLMLRRILWYNLVNFLSVSFPMAKKWYYRWRKMEIRQSR